MNLQSGWYAILSSREVTPEPREVRRFGLDLVAWRTRVGTAVIQANRCAHRSAKLSLGTIKKDCIKCPYHGIEYNHNGECSFVPEVQKAVPALHIQTFTVTEENDFIWLWLGEQPPQQKPQWFENLSAAWVYSERSEQWPMHFSRWVENEMDMVHLPFVHHNTIGKGMDPARKSTFEFSAGSMILDFNYGKPGPRNKDFAEFRYPNIWQLGVSTKMFLMMAFAPVDEQETKLYFRTYRTFGKLPLIRRLVDLGIDKFNAKVVAQDKRVVLSQPPTNTAYQEDEALSPEDTAIKHLREILRAAKPFGGLKIDDKTRSDSR